MGLHTQHHRLDSRARVPWCRWHAPTCSCQRASDIDLSFRLGALWQQLATTGDLQICQVSRLVQLLSRAYKNHNKQPTLHRDKTYLGMVPLRLRNLLITAPAMINAWRIVHHARRCIRWGKQEMPIRHHILPDITKAQTLVFCRDPNRTPAHRAQVE